MGGKGGWSTRQRPAPERFFEKVNAMGCCWEWDGAHKKAGYGNFAPERTHLMLAHRWAWEYLIGPIPKGMTLDHRCKNTRCVCPDHLEVVSLQVNTARGYGAATLNARKTHCHKGHEFTAENTRVNQKGDRVCRACEQTRQDDPDQREKRRQSSRRYKERQRAALAQSSARKVAA